MKAYHDDYILKYSRDLENSQISFYIKSALTDEVEILTIRNIVYVNLTQDIGESIIFAFDEVEPDIFLTLAIIELIKKEKRNGLNITGNTKEEIIDYFYHNNIKVIQLSSSLGLNGFIIFKEV
jgi:hypothetical protein